MKKLICATDVEALIQAGQNVLRIDSNTIITPSAQDMLKNHHMEVVTDTCTATVGTGGAAPLDVDTIYQVLVKLQEKGMLNDAFFASLPMQTYQAKKDASGLKVVQGASVNMEPFDKGNPASNVTRQEVIQKEDSRMRAGFLEIDRSVFDPQGSCEVVYYVVSGSVTVTVNGQSYEAQTGDVISVPQGTRFTCRSHNHARLFYTRDPK